MPLQNLLLTISLLRVEFKIVKGDVVLIIRLQVSYVKGEDSSNRTQF